MIDYKKFIADNKIKIIVISILVIFLLLVFCIYSRAVENDLLYGFYSASADFCERSNIKYMVFYIKENFIYGIIENEDGIILNDKGDISISKDISSLINPVINSYINYNIKIKWECDESCEVFPTIQNMFYYPWKGKLVFKENDYINAILYKNNIISEVE